MRSAEAAPLFDKAVDRFQEVIASGYLNWANVDLCRAHKLLDEAALAGAGLSAADAAAVSGHLAASEGRITTALEAKPGYYEGLSHMAGERRAAPAAAAVPPQSRPQRQAPAA